MVEAIIEGMIEAIENADDSNGEIGGCLNSAFGVLSQLAESGLDELENPQRVAPVCQTPLTLRKKSAYAPYKSWPTGSFLFWLIGFSRL